LLLEFDNAPDLMKKMLLEMETKNNKNVSL